MIKLILMTALFSSTSYAQSRSKEDQQLQKRIEELEKTVQTLQEKVGKMEGTLMKGGGFMITANHTCEINTPFDGSFAATELSVKAATASAIEQCKAKVADKSQCSDFLVKCDK